MKALLPIAALLLSVTAHADGPHHDDPTKAAEHAALLALVPVESATITAARSGDWNSPSTWNAAAGPPRNAAGQTEDEYYRSWVVANFLALLDSEQDATVEAIGRDILAVFVPVDGSPVEGKTPAGGDHVHIPAGLTVTLDSQEASRLRTVRVDGTLRFDPAASTRLLVDTIVVTPTGRLVIGEPDLPVTGSAEVVFTDDGPIDTAWDGKLLSRGLLSHGAVSIHGSPTDTWGPVGSIDGPELTTENGALPPAGFTHYEANLDRSVVFTSESPATDRRGHVMLMHSADISISYAAFVGLGRTDKARPIDDVGLLNKRGRYALHFHRCGPTPIAVNGVVVFDSPGWGVVNHSSNVLVTDSVTRDVLGAGFVAEAGDELGRFERCLAVRSLGSGQAIDLRKDSGDFGHAGHGFWLQSNQVALVDNVAAGHPSSAFQVYGKGYVEADTGKVADPDGPARKLAEYRGNLAFASQIGHFIYWATDPENVVEDAAAWGVGAGVEIRKAAANIEGGEFIGARGANTAIHFVSGYGGTGNVADARIEGWKVGIRAPTVGDKAITASLKANRFDIYATQEQSGGSVTLRDIGAASIILQSDTVRSFTHFNQCPPRPIYLEQGGVTRQLYFANQASGFIPYAVKHAAWPDELVGLTNAEIRERFGWLPAGALAPADAEDRGGYLIGK